VAEGALDRAVFDGTGNDIAAINNAARREASCASLAIALLVLGTLENSAVGNGIMHAVGMISQCFVAPRQATVLPASSSREIECHPPLGLVLEARERAPISTLK
jgi:hypothetical protein